MTKQTARSDIKKNIINFLLGRVYCCVISSNVSLKRCFTQRQSLRKQPLEKDENKHFLSQNRFLWPHHTRIIRVCNFVQSPNRVSNALAQKKEREKKIDVQKLCRQVLLSFRRNRSCEILIEFVEWIKCFRGKCPPSAATVFSQIGANFPKKFGTNLIELRAEEKIRNSLALWCYNFQSPSIHHRELMKLNQYDYLSFWIYLLLYLSLALSIAFHCAPHTNSSLSLFFVGFKFCDNDYNREHSAFNYLHWSIVCHTN